MSKTSSRGSKSISTSSSKTTFSALPDAAIFEILSKTDNPKELIKACAINKQYAEYCAKHKEQINKAQMLHKYPHIGKIMEHPYTFLNMMLYRKFDLNKLISLGATQYMKLYGISKNLSWENNFENLGVLITMFGVDPKDVLSHMIKYNSEYDLTVEQFKEVYKFVKAVQPYFKLEETLLQHIIKFYFRHNAVEKFVEILNFVLPEYRSLSAITIGQAFLTPALERDLDLLWSFLIKLDPETINDIVNTKGKKTLLDVLLNKHFTIPDDTPAIRAQRKERFLLHLLSLNPNVNIGVKGGWTTAQTAFKEDISPTLTDTVLLEILKRADLSIKGLSEWTFAHLVFHNKNLSEKVYLALLKRKPDLNNILYQDLGDYKSSFTPAYLAFTNRNITEKVLLEILKQEDIDIGLKYNGGYNLLMLGLNPNRTNIGLLPLTEKVLLKLIDKGGSYIYDKNDNGLDAMVFAFLNKDISDNVLSYIISAHQPIQLDKEYSYYPIQGPGPRTKVSKTLRDIINDAGKGYLLNEIQPVKSAQPAPSSSTQPGPSSSAQPSSGSSAQPTPSKGSSKSTPGGKRRMKSKK